MSEPFGREAPLRRGREQRRPSAAPRPGEAQVYIAQSETYYMVTAVGRTADEAVEAMARELLRTNNSGYGLDCKRTLKAVLAHYCGDNARVVGPLRFGEGHTE